MENKREYDGSFAQLEVGFILNDPRCTMLTSNQFRAYIILWVIAVKERRELLSVCWTTNALQQKGTMTARTWQRSTNALHEKGLIELTPEGRIRVCGVRSKHLRLKWKDEDLQEISPQFDQTERETEVRNRNKKLETERETDQLVGRDVDNSEKDFDSIPGESEALARFKAFCRENWPKIAVLLNAPQHIELTDGGAKTQVEDLKFHFIAGDLYRILQDNGEKQLRVLREYFDGNWLRWISRQLGFALTAVHAGKAKPSAHIDPMTSAQEQQHYLDKQVREIGNVD